MRNIQLFTLFFFLPSLSFGQEIYRPFLEEGKVWTYHYYNDMTGREFYKSLTIAGDTVIDDKSYKRIVDVATGNYEYAIREEGKKVFCAKPNNAETLIYDFGLNVGDSFQSSGNSNSDTQTTVIGVDTVVVGNRAFRILDVRLNNDLWPNLWVEGVGGMYDLSSNFPKVGNFYSFSSCQLDGETILTQKDVWKTVGIQNQLISNKDSYDNHLFDLHGRRIQGEPKGKGIYVKNRKKIVMKWVYGSIVYYAFTGFNATSEDGHIRPAEDHGDRFLNEFTEFIQKPVPMISQGLNSIIIKGSFIENGNYYEDFINLTPWWE